MSEGGDEKLKKTLLRVTLPAVAVASAVAPFLGVHASFDYTNTFTPIVNEITLGVAAIVVVSAVIVGSILGLKFGFAWLRRVVK